jgi:endogenous inhibitor of DNA gyrase (YacG/DUF329 family)
VLPKDPDFPFCSERCRLIDLGKWASGGYVISTPINRGDESGEADYTSNQRVERVQDSSSRVRQPSGSGQERQDDDRTRH